MADEKEVVSKIAISKISTKAGLDAKFKALERAENAYYQAKGQAKQQVNPDDSFYCYCLFKYMDELNMLSILIKNVCF